MKVWLAMVLVAAGIGGTQTDIAPDPFAIPSQQPGQFPGNTSSCAQGQLPGTTTALPCTQNGQSGEYGTMFPQPAPGSPQFGGGGSIPGGATGSPTSPGAAGTVPGGANTPGGANGIPLGGNPGGR